MFFSASDSLSHPEYSHNLPFPALLFLNKKNIYIEINSGSYQIASQGDTGAGNNEQHNDSCRKDKLEMGDLCLMGRFLLIRRGLNRHYSIKEPCQNQLLLHLSFIPEIGLDYFSVVFCN